MFYHVFNRGLNKNPIFEDASDKRFFLYLLETYIKECELKAFAFCLMDNHYHLFVQTLRPNLDVFMQRLQGHYAAHFNAKMGRIGALFGGRYKSKVVEDDKYALTLLRYIHLNPDEIGYDYEKYLWSSYGAYVEEQRKFRWLETKEMLELFGKETNSAKQRFIDLHGIRVPEKGSDPFSKRGLTPFVDIRFN